MKWQLLLAVISIMLAVAIFLGAGYFNSQAEQNLNIARVDLQTARQDVASIEEQEATIIEYIDRYEQLSAEGIVDTKDLLQFRENMYIIRENNDLFPIQIAPNSQQTLRLQYDPQENNPGGPIDLQSMEIDISLPLLHEEDLHRLLSEFLNSPGLFQTRECVIRLNNPNATNFLSLGQHQTAECSFIWYTFDVNPPQQENAFF